MITTLYVNLNASDNVNVISLFHVHSIKHMDLILSFEPLRMVAGTYINHVLKEHKSTDGE